MVAGGYRARSAGVEYFTRLALFDFDCTEKRAMPLEIINLVVGLTFLAVWALVGTMLVRQI
jgi:hypothetical protein